MGAVIIGLGGGGKTILMKLRRMMVEEFGKLDSDTRFVHVDTYTGVNQEPNQDFVLKVLGIDIALTPSERIELSAGLSPAETGLLLRNPSVRRWFPPDLPEVNLATGAGGVRAYGRLAFHHKVAEYRNKVEAAMRRAATAGTVDLFIVCSLFGGTGSGSFLDACYVSAAARLSVGYRGENHGFFIIGGAPDPTASNNCYAALKELEYHTTLPFAHQQPPASGSERPQPFRADFPIAGENPIVSMQAPLDSCYLFEAENGYDGFRTRSEFEEMVAKRIFLELMPGCHGPMVAKRVDLKAQPGAMGTDTLQQRAKTFFCTGCSTIEFPAPRLQNACGAVLTAACAKHLAYETAPGFDNLKTATTDFVDSCFDSKLDPVSLGQALNQLGDGRTVQDSAREDRAKKYNMLDEHMKSGAWKDGSIDLHVEDVLKDVAKSTGSEGLYGVAVRQNTENLLQRNSGKIRQRLAGFVDNPNIGPVQTQKLIGLVSAQIIEYKNQTQRKLGILDKATQVAFATVEKKQKHLRADKRYRWEAGKHIDWLCNRDLKNLMTRSLDRIAQINLLKLYDSVLGDLAAEEKRIKEYVARLVAIKELYQKEGKTICENLVTWVDNESRHGSTHFAHLDDLSRFLDEFNKHCDTGQFEKIHEKIAELARSFGVESLAAEIIRPPRVVDTIGSPYTGMTENEEGFSRELFMACRTKYAALRQANICNMLTRLDASAREQLFQQKLNLSHWFLRVFTADPTIAHNPAVHEHKYLIAPEGTPLEDHEIWRGTLAQIPQRSRTNSLPDFYRLVLASEMSVFCLRNVGMLDQYAQTFSRLSNAEIPRYHTCSTVRYPDIMPPSDEVMDIIRRASAAEVFGKITGTIRAGLDPETDDNALFLYYRDAAGIERTRKLCGPNDGILTLLRAEQEDKQLRFAGTGQTALEIIEVEITRIAQKARKEPEAGERLCTAIQAYLEDFLDETPGDNGTAKRHHPSYQRQIDLVSDFLTRNRITCPSLGESIHA